MDFFEGYFKLLADRVCSVDSILLEKAKETIVACNRRGGKVIVVGNGGSASIAGHVALDLSNAAKIRATAINDADLITCFANDYGYERWVEKALEYCADAKDVALLISSSGKSPNITNAAEWARKNGLKVITLSGFSSDNPLRRIGDVNLWVDSDKYNIIEITHNIWLLAIVERIREGMRQDVGG